MKWLMVIGIVMGFKIYSFEELSAQSFPPEIKHAIILLPEADPKKLLRLMRLTSKSIRSELARFLPNIIENVANAEQKHPIDVALSIATPEAENFVEQWRNAAKIKLRRFPQYKVLLVEEAEQRVKALLEEDIQKKILGSFLKKTIEEIYRPESDKSLLKRQIVILSKIFKEDIYERTLRQLILDMVDRNSIVVREKKFKDLMALNLGKDKAYVQYCGSIQEKLNTLLSSALHVFRSHVKKVASYPQIPPVQYCCFIIEILRSHGAQLLPEDEKLIKKYTILIENILKSSRVWYNA